MRPGKPVNDSFRICYAQMNRRLENAELIAQVLSALARPSYFSVKALYLYELSNQATQKRGIK